MWKEGSTRRVIPSKLTSRRRLGWSGAFLLAALLAALIGFQSRSPVIAGMGKFSSFLFVLCFAVLLVKNFSYLKRPQ